VTLRLAPQVCVVSASLVQLSFVNDNPELTRNLHNVLCFLNPLYPLMGCLNCITKVGAPACEGSLPSGFSPLPPPVCSLRPQATFLHSLYEEDFLWKNLVIAVIAVRILYMIIHGSAQTSPSSAVTSVPLFLCSSVPVFLCSSVPLFLCSCVPLFLCSSVPVFLCSSVPVFLCSSVPLFLCSCVPVFLCSCVPLFLCSCVQPYLQCILLLFLLRWLEIRYGGRRVGR